MSDRPANDRVTIEDLTEAMSARYLTEGYTLAFAEDVMRYA